MMRHRNLTPQGSGCSFIVVVGLLTLVFLDDVDCPDKDADAVVAGAGVARVLPEQEGVGAAKVGVVLHAGAPPLHLDGVDDGHGVEVLLPRVPLALNDSRYGAVERWQVVIGDVVGVALTLG